MTIRLRIIGHATLLGILALASACASSPPPPPSEPPPPPPAAVETPPPPPSAPPEAGPAPAVDTQAQAPVECQAAEDCKSKGDLAAGSAWACDSGRCTQQTVAEAPKADEPPAETKDDKPQQKKTKRGQKKK